MLLEMQGMKTGLLRKLEEALQPTSSFIPWIPAKPKRGTISRRWGIILNEQD